MPLVTDVFKRNNPVQVIDPATGIWENEKILVILSFWSVKIKYTVWSATKAGLPTIEVPQGATSHFDWPIRQPVQGTLVRGKRSRENLSDASVKNAAKKFRHDKVCYAGPAFPDPTDIPSLTELRKMVANSRRVKTGQVVSMILSANDS